MTIEAKIIADSIGHKSKRLITFQLRYPRFIHAELMTHRQFSRNASSSRAIPVEKMINDIMSDTAMPIHWGKNQPGMQADEELVESVIVSHMDLDGGDEHRFYGTPQDAWLAARDRAVEVAQGFVKAGYHKQVVNRILEPYMHISVVVTSSNFDNFYWLRCHKDAQPEIKALADAMWAAQQASEPKILGRGDWHLPYVREEELRYCKSKQNLLQSSVQVLMSDLIKCSVARCARVSYLTHDGKEPDRATDLKLYDRLVGSTPLHASPAEHQATPDTAVWSTYDTPMWENAHLSGNLDEGWIQYRKMLSGEVCNSYVPA